MHRRRRVRRGTATADVLLVQQAADGRVGGAGRVEGPGQPRVRVEKVGERIPLPPVRPRPGRGVAFRCAQQPLQRRAPHPQAGGGRLPRGGGGGGIGAQALEVSHERCPAEVGAEAAGDEGDGDEREEAPLEEIALGGQGYDEEGRDGGPEDGRVDTATNHVEPRQVEGEDVHVVGEQCAGVDRDDDEDADGGDVGLGKKGKGDEDARRVPQRLDPSSEAVAGNLGQRINLEGEERGGEGEEDEAGREQERHYCHARLGRPGRLARRLRTRDPGADIIRRIATVDGED